MVTEYTMAFAGARDRKAIAYRNCRDIPSITNPRKGLERNEAYSLCP